MGDLRAIAGMVSVSDGAATADDTGAGEANAAEAIDRADPADASADVAADGPTVGEAASVADLLEALLAQTGYIEALEAERTIEAQGRIENLEQLVEVAREFDAAAAEDERTLDVFLAEIALVADADARSDDEGLVTLMTLHNAKGLEYPTVFIAGCEDGVFPHSRAIDEGGLEEERRLFYVGVTRAMRRLYLSYARRRAVFGAQTYGMRSRFLDEIPADLLDEPHEAVFRPEALPGGLARGATVSAARGAGATSMGSHRAGTLGGGGGAQWGSGGGADAVNRFRLGEDVVHAAFGDGVVTGVEPDGVIVVRFAGDGSERKLMAEYAPVSRR
jgi:DNA helicase-2/ATP-dependent DNA helicase PcrA